MFVIFWLPTGWMLTPSSTTMFLILLHYCIAYSSSKATWTQMIHRTSSEYKIHVTASEFC